jgi:serine protein kinase
MNNSIFSKIVNEQKTLDVELFSLEEYLELCRTDKQAYATAPERMLKAIGEPQIVDTSKNARLSRIFLNRSIKVYPAFEDFHGMEEVIERIVGYFTHSAQGLEEKKQILYLLGPVGGGKSSLAERLKELIQQEPIFVLADSKGNLSPVFETPLGVFNKKKHGTLLEQEYGIPQRYLTDIMSPWAIKRLKELGGDVSRFKVAKIYPSKLEQVAVMKTEPGDDNNQDISSLVGKTNIRMLEKFDQNDPDSYMFSGALCRGNQGVLEFVEMFKAPIKMLHPLLTATQEGNYIGTEGISAIPFNGIVLAHSNEAEWQTFKNNKNNEAFIDRIYVVKVPYCLRVAEETKIYKKMLENSELSSAPCVPETLNMLSQLGVLTRLKEHENSNLISKMRVYDGENIRDQDPKAKSLQEYRDTAGVDEGMSGISTRFAFKILSKTFNFDHSEVAADPVHLMYVMEDAIRREQFSSETEEKYINFIKENLQPKYAEKLGNEIQKAYLESYSDFGQNLFDRYIEYADHWIQEIDYRDPDTGNLFDREILNQELEKIEKPAGIANPKDFRNEVVNFVLRARARSNNNIVVWTSYEKLREVIEKKMFASTEELLPVISFATKANSEDQKKHDDFVDRMVSKGYTPKQVRRLVEWYLRVQKSS